MTDNIPAYLAKVSKMNTALTKFAAPINAAIQKVLQSVDMAYVTDYVNHGSAIESIVLHRHFYQKSNNPLHAWKAIQIAKECQLHKLPEWAVSGTLDRASAIVGLDPNKASTSIAFKEALGINGNMIKQFRRAEKWFSLYFTIAERNKSGETLETLFNEFSDRLHLSEVTIKRHYFTFQRQVNDKDYDLAAFGS